MRRYTTVGWLNGLRKRAVRAISSASVGGTRSTPASPRPLPSNSRMAAPTRSAPVLDLGQLREEAVREADVVGVHPGHDVVGAGSEPTLQRLGKTDVVRQAKSTHRHRRRRLQTLEGRGELGADVAVLDDDDLVRSAQLLVHGAAERRLEVRGHVTAVHGQQEGEGSAHAVDAREGGRPDGERAATATWRTREPMPPPVTGRHRSASVRSCRGCRAAGRGS